MYALVEIKGKQYRAEAGSVLKVDRINNKKGDVIEFTSVLLVSDEKNITVGKPYIDGTKIKAVVEEHGKDKKIIVLKFKRRKSYRRTSGHRRQYTVIKVQEIAGPHFKSETPPKKEKAVLKPEKTVITDTAKKTQSDTGKKTIKTDTGKKTAKTDTVVKAKTDTGKKTAKTPSSGSKASSVSKKAVSKPAQGSKTVSADKAAGTVKTGGSTKTGTKKAGSATSVPKTGTKKAASKSSSVKKTKPKSDNG